MASLKFRHYVTESALIGSSTLQVALNAMDVGDIVFIDDTQKQYIITSKNNNVVTYSTYYGKAAIIGVTGTGATRTLTFSDGSEITITIDNVEHAITSESCSGNANSATTLQNTRKINGTNFNGSADITTNNWGVSRNIGIVNSDGSGTAIPISINGSNNINLKLPSTIKANLEGNISGSSTSCSGNSLTASKLTNLSGSDTASSSTTWRKVWFSYDDGVTGRPALIDNFAYQTSTNTLKVPNLTLSGNATINGTTTVSRLTVNGKASFNNGLTGTLTGNLIGNASTASSCSGNAATATKLQTARTIWGQSFDGSGNISGALTGVTSITASGTVTSSNTDFLRSTFGSYGTIFEIYKGKMYVLLTDKDRQTGANNSLRPLTIEQSNGNIYLATTTEKVGIGTTSPTSKLHVAGTGYFTSDVSSASNIIAGGYIKGETVKISSGCTLQYDSAQKCVKFVF